MVDDVFMSIQVDKMNLIRIVFRKAGEFGVSDAFAECGKGKSISIHQTEKGALKELTDGLI